MRIISMLCLGFVMALGFTPSVAAVSLTISPTTAAVNQGATKTFVAAVSGTTNTAVTWSVIGTGHGTVSTSGVYTAPIKAGSFIVRVTSKADTAKYAEATVTLPAIALSVGPATAVVNQGATQAFTATITGVANTGVAWSVVPATGGGTVSTTGLYTAPIAAGTFKVRATSKADTTKYGEVTVTVPVLTISVNPTTANVAQGASQAFTATVTGAKVTTVTWAASGGTITTGGSWKAPATAGTYTITATSKADTAKKATATVKVPIKIAISPASVSVAQGATRQFTTTVTGTTNTSVSWSKNGGTITTGGLYTAPAIAGSYTVTATTAATPAMSAIATVTVPDIAIALNAATATVVQGGTKQFTATVTGASNTGVTWSVTPTTGGGSVSTSGLYKAPSAAGIFIVRATSKADTARYAEASITVPDVSIAVVPASATMDPASTQQFTATVSGATNTGVYWDVTDSQGSISTSGLYKASREPGTYTVTATSKADTTRIATATVTVRPVVIVTIQPTAAALTSHSTQVFLPHVTGSGNTAVTWSVLGGSANGWVTPSGIYNAPAKPGMYSVVATSVADPAKQATATVTVQNSAGFQVSLSPQEIVLAAGDSYAFRAESFSASSETYSYSYSASGGTIQDDSEGNFTYFSPWEPGDYWITAKVQGTSAQASAIVHVQARLSGISLTVNPQGLVLGPNGGEYLSAKVTGTANTAVSWSIIGGDANGLFLPQGDYWGVYTAPALTGTYTVVATSVAEPSKTAQTVIQVIPSVNVSGPWQAYMNEAAQFSATVYGLSDQGVTWEASAGAITQDGAFTASSPFASVMITATSNVDPRAKGTVWVRVPDISLRGPSLKDISIPAGATSPLVAQVEGTSNPAVVWSVVSGGGSIVPDSKDPGRASFLAPYATGTSVVQGASVADPTKTVTITFTMLANSDVVLRSFSATPCLIAPGDAAALLGDFWNGTGVVQPGNQVMAPSASIEVSPQGSVNYTLTVTSADGNQSRTLNAPLGVIGPGRTSALPPPNYMSSGYTQQTRLLLDREGRVLLVGGYDLDTSRFMVERFDPAANAWSTVGRLAANIPDDFQALMLPNGNLLLMLGRSVVCGGGYERYYVGPNYLLDPETGIWTILGMDHVSNPCVAPLDNGKILVAGGRGFPIGTTWCYIDCFVDKSSAFLFDLNTLATTALPLLSQIQGACDGVPLLDGRVLILGKSAAGEGALEVFDPQAGSFTLVGTYPSLSFDHGAMRTDGKVVLQARRADLHAIQAGVWDPNTGLLQWDPRTFTTMGCGPLLPDGWMLSGPRNSVSATYDPFSFLHHALQEYEPVGPGSYPTESLLLQSGKAIMVRGADARRFDSEAPLVVTPASSFQNLGVPVPFSASGPAAASGVTWRASRGTITDDGLFTAAVTGLHMISATSSTGKVAYAQINIVPSVLVLVGRGMQIPTPYHVGQPWPFKVRVLNHPNTAVTWSLLEGAEAGSITAEGVYVASTPGTYHVVATSQADPTKSDSFTVNAVASVQLSISPATLSMLPGETATFAANELNGDSGAHWSSNGVNYGGGRSCNYVAPMEPGTYTLTAMSSVDPSKSATAIVTVVPITSLAITPVDSSITMLAGSRFHAFATSSLGTKEITDRVTWTCTGGTMSTNSYVVFHAPVTPGTYAVQALLTGTTLTASTTIQVVPIDAFYLTPSRYVMAPGERINIQAYIKSSCGTFALPDNPVWSCTGGNVDQQHYRAPSTPGTYTVQAVIAGTTISAIAKMMVVSSEAFKTNEGGAQTYRNGFTLTRLLDGRVLIAGGNNNTAEMYDPATKLFSAVAATMVQARSNHSAALLPDGKILLVGGVYDTNQPVMAELFDPSTQTFTATKGAPLFRRYNAALILLPNGRVLVSGADGYSGKSMEIFDPTTGCFTPAGYLSQFGGISGLLSDGRVLFASVGSSHDIPDAVETFNYKTGAVALVNSMQGWHSGSSLMPAADGRTWVLGGTPPQGETHLATEWFAPESNQFSLGPNLPLVSTQAGFGVTELVDGSVYLFENNGYTGNRLYPDTSLLDSARSIPVGAAANYGKAALLPTGEVLRVGYLSSATPRGSVLCIFDTTPNAVILPRHITLVAGRSWPFQASATGLGSAGFVWSIQEGDSGGTITAQGVYTAPFTAGRYHVVAVSAADGAIQATALVDVVKDIEVTLSPALLQLAPGAVQTFSAGVIGSSNTGITWSASAGTVSSDGTFTAPATLGLCTVTATSLADGNESATATINVSGSGGSLPAPIIAAFTSDTPTVVLGQAANLSWNVIGAYQLLLTGGGISKDVTGLSGWSVRPTATSQYTLHALNPVGNLYSQAVTVAVTTTSVTISITPTTVALYCGQSQQFGYTLSAPTNRIVWKCTRGSITQAGLYTAPNEPGTDTITVVSVDDPGKSASATVTVNANNLDLTILPGSVDLIPNQTQPFSYNYNGPANPVLTWSASGGTISTAGLFTAPAVSGTYTVTLTIPGIGMSSTATVMVKPITLSISPTSIQLMSGQTQQFGVTVNGGAVTWSVVEANGGTINQGGFYTAPAAPGVYTVQVASQVDPSKTAKASVIVNPISIAINPASVTLEVNQSMQFGATLSAGAWTWSATGGMVEDGRYRAPAIPGTYSVSVQSNLDPSKVATAQVTVIPTNTLGLEPLEFVIHAGATIQMNLQGAPIGASVTWTVCANDGSAGGGAVTLDGRYTAGNIQGLYFVKANVGGNLTASQVRIVSHRVYPENPTAGMGQKLQFTAMVYDTSPSVTWSVMESAGGTIDTKGLYTAPLQQGQYHVVAETSQGNIVSIPVIVGPPDGFVLSPEVHVLTAGTYQVEVQLRASNNQTTQSISSADLPAGVSTLDVAFSQDQLKRDLAVDGPYTVDQVQMRLLQDDELLDVDRKASLGSTTSYAIAEADKPWITIGAIQEVVGEDTNGNGRIDTLKVQINVTVICDGTYTIGGGLAAADGTEIDYVQKDLQLPKGSSIVTLAFDGKQIYQSGKSGPYTIKDFTVTGPVTQSVSFPAAVSGYALDQFEH